MADQDKRGPLVIIKADDFIAGRFEIQWRAFLSLAQKERFPVALGVVGEPTEQALRRDPRALDWLKPLLSAGGHELWNHGYTHRRGEFLGADVASQAHSIAACQRVLAEIGVGARTFGAPFNRHDDATDQACAENPSIEIVFHQEDVPGRYCLPVGLILGCENRALGDDPDVRGFRRQLDARPRDVSQPLVLQVHPWRWSERGLADFAVLIRSLRDEGATFVTARQLHDAWNGRAIDRSAGAPDLALVCELYGRRALAYIERRTDVPRLSHPFFRSRYQRGLASWIAYLEQLGFTEEHLGRDLRALDIGAGVGQFALAFALRNPTSKVHALDPGEDFLGVLRHAIAGTEVANRIRIDVTGAEQAELPVAAYDLSCSNGVLMYCEHEAAMARTADSLKLGGLHYIAYHQDGHYLRKIADALDSGSAAEARTWARHLAAVHQFNCGLSTTLTPERCLPLAQLERLFDWFGFEILRRPTLWSEEPREFHAWPSVCELLLARRRPPRSPADASIDELDAWAELVPRAVFAFLDQDGRRHQSARHNQIWMRAAMMAEEILTIPPEELSGDSVDTYTRSLYLMHTGQAAEAGAVLLPLARSDDRALFLAALGLRFARRIPDARELVRARCHAGRASILAWSALLYIDSCFEDLSLLAEDLARCRDAAR